MAGTHTLAEDYRDPAKAPFVRAHRLRGPNAYVMDIVQPAGAYGSPPCDELTIVMPRIPGIRLQKRWGDARFEGVAPVNSVWLVPPRTSTELTIHSANAIRTLSIRTEFLATSLVPDDLVPDLDALHRHPFFSRSVARMVEALWEAVSFDTPQEPLFVDCVLQALLVELRSLSGRRPKAPRSGLAPWQIRRVTAAMAEDRDNLLSLHALAALVGLSPFHFGRLFKASLGVSPQRYQRHMRLERASQMLRQHTGSVTEIAQAVGYESSQAFARAFREAYAQSPTDYRRSWLT